MKLINLSHRGVLRISGDDTEDFLQGLISNDVRKADGTQGVYAGFLTPQGKYLYDFFIVGVDDALLLDIARADLPAFHKKLRMYKLRSKVNIEDVSDDFGVFAIIGDDAVLPDDAKQTSDATGVVRYVDPRLSGAGLRAVVPATIDPAGLGIAEGTTQDYQDMRIALGLPEAPTDLQPEKSILLESGFDELNGVDWTKGCYMGQELTARTKYRGLIKKRLVCITWQNGAVAPGTDIVADGKVVGDVRSVTKDIGIAMVRLDALQRGASMAADGVAIDVQIPAWMALPAAEENAVS